jgi:hypothetical protein
MMTVSKMCFMCGLPYCFCPVTFLGIKTAYELIKSWITNPIDLEFKSKCYGDLVCLHHQGIIPSGW